MGAIKVILIGGPSYSTADHRVEFVDSLDTTIKVPFGAGYEHFAHRGEYRSVEGEAMPVFEWKTRTRVAE